MPSQKKQQKSQQNSQDQQQQLISECRRDLAKWAQDTVLRTRNRQSLVENFVKLELHFGFITIWDTLRRILIISLTDSKCPLKEYKEFFEIISSSCASVAFKSKEELPILGLEEDTQYLLIKFLLLLIESSCAKSNDIKLRIIYCFECLTQDLYKNNCTVDEDLGGKLLFALGNLCLEKNLAVRIAAIKVIAMMQSDCDPDCCVWKIFRHLIATDVTPTVIVTILNSMKVTKYNLKNVLHLVMCIKPEISLAAVQCLADKVNPKILSHVQMCTIFRQLMSQRDVKACMFIREKLFPLWLSTFSSILSKFVAAFGPSECKENETVIDNLLVITKSLISDEYIFNDFSISEQVIDLNAIELTPEKVFVLHFFISTVGKNKFRTISRNLYPDLSQLCHQIKLLLTLIESTTDEAEAQKLEFTCTYLIKCLKYYDHGETDEIRAKIDEEISLLIEDYPTKSEKIIHAICELLMMLYDTDYENFCERISKFVEQTLGMETSNKENLENTTDQSFIISQDSVNIIKALLLIQNSLSVLPDKVKLPEKFTSLCQKLVLPSFRNDTLGIRYYAIESLFQFCMKNQEICCTNINFFVTAIRNDVNELKKLALQCCFDLWLYNDYKIFKNAVLNTTENLEMSIDGDDNPQSKMVREFLLTFIWSDDNALRFVTVNSMCKLFLKNELKSPTTLATLFMNYCNSLIQEEHLELFSILSDFFMLYPNTAKKYKHLMAKIAIPFSKIIEEAPEDSVISKKVDIEFAAENLVKYTHHMYTFSVDEDENAANDDNAINLNYFESPHGMMVKEIFAKIDQDPLNPYMLFLFLILKNVTLPYVENDLITFSTKIEDYLGKVKFIDFKMILRNISMKLRRQSKALNLNCFSQRSSQQPASQKSSNAPVTDSAEDEVEMVTFS